jgi:hypothetical protein
MARMRRQAVPIILAFLALGADVDQPGLKLRANPPFSLALPGHSRHVLLTAEIVGPETEEYYCPEVIWLWSNGTLSSEESDCEPFAARIGYPRHFNRDVASPPQVHPYQVCVEIRKAGRKIDRSCTSYSVR